jgi:hypothetical protein
MTTLLVSGISGVSAAEPTKRAGVAATPCNTAVHDPHWSTNGGTVVGKLTWSCPSGSAVDHYEMKLYVCKYTPYHDFGGWHCTNKQLRYTRTGGPVGGAGTRYIPETGDKVRGCGNWMINGSTESEGWGGNNDSPHYVYDCHAP